MGCQRVAWTDATYTSPCVCVATRRTACCVPTSCGSNRTSQRATSGTGVRTARVLESSCAGVGGVGHMCRCASRSHTLFPATLHRPQQPCSAHTARWRCASPVTETAGTSTTRHLLDSGVPVTAGGLALPATPGRRASRQACPAAAMTATTTGTLTTLPLGQRTRTWRELSGRTPMRTSLASMTTSRIV